MRSVLGIAFSAAALALTVGCGKKDSAGGGGAPTPDGTYVITSLEVGGETMPQELFEKSPEDNRTIKFSKDQMTAKKGDREESIAAKYDASKSPAHITTTETKANGKTETTYGIYKIDGDTLTICVVEAGKGEEDRPREFKTAKGSKNVLMTLNKKK